MRPPRPVKISHKKMATEGSLIDFMFLISHLATGTTTECDAIDCNISNVNSIKIS